jgi:AAA domain, putative AbiEii toxin, Type IV TA system
MSGLGINEPRYQPPKIAQLLGQGKPGDVIRNLLVEASENAPAWQELKDAVVRLFGYEILSPNAQGADIIAEYRPGDGGPNLDIASSGSGFQQVLMLLTFLLVRPGSVLLLDEPDAHLHVLLQDAIYNELRTIAAKKNSRLLIATHSEVIINSVAPEELCMLLTQQPRLLSSTAERQRLSDALGILTNLDLILVEGAPGVLFTEDATDLEILREWAKALKHPVYPALVKGILWKKSSHQQREGASGISANEYFDKLRLVRDDLRGLELLDRDGNPHLKATQITGKGLQRLRWDRYEIESYLFHPTALKRYVAEKAGAGNSALHVADLEKYLQATSPPQFLAEPFANLPFLTGTKARTELLPPTLAAAGLHGIPYTSYSEIAAIMLPEEIHPEVKQKLDQIQKAFNL